MRFLLKINIIFLATLANSFADISIRNSLPDKYSPEIIYKKSSFLELKKWNNANQLKSFNTFKKSCKKIYKQNKYQYSSWINLCQKAININFDNIDEARLFFENNFTPYKIIYDGKDTGIFTGYYEPTIKGSLTKTSQYDVPIYKTPKNLVKIFKDGKYKFGTYKNGKLVPHYTRAQISEGNFFHDKDILVWIKSRIDRSFLQIQGSGRIQTDRGDILLGYESQNGHPYRPIGKYLLDNGHISLKEMSMQSIKKWINNNQSKINEVLNYDPSFVFFRYLDAKNPIGAQGVELTPAYSLAIDNKYYLYGMPMWIESEYYKKNHTDKVPLNRLMISQDRGGAIKGPIRGDVFWGHGKQAEFNAGHMNNLGKLWILLPNQKT